MIEHALIEIPAAHPAFPGHFPGMPILPGVVLLDEALHAIAAARGADRAVAGGVAEARRVRTHAGRSRGVAGPDCGGRGNLHAARRGLARGMTSPCARDQETVVRSSNRGQAICTSRRARWAVTFPDLNGHKAAGYHRER